MGEKVCPLAFLSFRKQLLSTVNFVCTMWCLAGAAQWALLGCLCCCYLFIYCTQLSAVAERDGGSEQSVKVAADLASLSRCHVVLTLRLDTAKQIAVHFSNAQFKSTSYKRKQIAMQLMCSILPLQQRENTFCSLFLLKVLRW